MSQLLKYLARRIPGFGAHQDLDYLQREWEAVVGEYLARNMTPYKIDRDGTLWCWVPHPTWVVELRPVMGSLLKTVSGAAKSIKFIKLSVGQPRSLPRFGERPKAPRVTEDYPQPVATNHDRSGPLLEDVAKVSDPELRAILERIVRRPMGR